MISPTSVCGDARPLQKHVASVVPLGKDADDLAAVEHQQRADVLVGHHLAIEKRAIAQILSVVRPSP